MRPRTPLSANGGSTPSFLDSTEPNRCSVSIESVTKVLSRKVPPPMRDAEREFAAWVEPCWPAMNALARRLAPVGDADDVAQSALITAWQKRDSFDPKRGSPRAWLLALTADHARRLQRQQARRPTPATAADSRSVTDYYPDSDLHAAVIALPRRQRLAVELVYYLQLPIREAAQAMNCREGTVKSTLASARARLRNELTEESP